MKEKIKRILAMMLTCVMMITFATSNMTIAAVSNGDTGKASLENLGKLGTVNIGEKSESGTWLKTQVDDMDVFCLDLGKACHTGYVYQAKISTISSDSKSTKAALKAKIGYWYSVKKKFSNKAWVYAQCLIWSVEEGCTTEDELKDVIRQVKDNTGYYSNDSIYSDIFNVDSIVSCEIITWEYSGKTDEDEVQALMQITGMDITYPHKSLSKTEYYRQRITLEKTDEDGSPLSQVSFKFTIKNVKELHSYQFNGWGDSVKDDVDDNVTKFNQTVLTDSKGKIAFRFTYKIQAKKYYYLEADILDELSSADKKALKDEWDDKGYSYAANLSKSGAEKLADDDINKQMDEISNNYIIEEVLSGNSDILTEFTIASGSDKVTSHSANKVTVTLKKADSWTKNSDGKWPETAEGSYGNYGLAYKPVLMDKFKKVKLIALKKDNETGELAQGDATLAGAVYGMYEDEACTKLIKKYTTDAHNQFETDYVRCGKNYYLKEITPPKGYLKNEEVYTVYENGQAYTAEYNSTKSKIELGEDIVKGKVSIIKGKGNGTAGIVDPEINAQFQVYLASSGSYDAAKLTEKDLLKTNKDGYAITKELPYGTYIVHQLSGDEGTEFCPDFYVDVRENGMTYKYLLNNPEFMAYLKIVKKDNQTKQTVLKSNTTYQIYMINADGTESLVKQSYNNGNEIVTVDRFVSDESGEIITYEKLKVGKYRVYEVQGPDGFKNDKTFIDIEITDKSYKTMRDENGNEYLYAEYEYYNNETYGKFTVKKTGSKVVDFVNEVADNSLMISKELPTEGINIPAVQSPFKYEDVALNDVVFELYTKEDIMTQDGQGTKWFQAGDLVATITTGQGARFTSECSGICKFDVDENGAVTLNVPLGKYEIREVKTVYGYVLPKVSAWDLNFVWSNQDEDYVLDISENTVDGVLDIRNDLVSTEITITKQDAKTFKPIPNTTFGFYTKDNIYDKDGNVILKADSKIATVTTDEEGKAVIPFSVPVMGIGYGETDAAINSGNYYFLEEKVSDSYYVAEEPKFVHLEYKNQETATVTVKAKALNEQTEVEVDKLMIASSVEIPGCHLKISDIGGNEIISWTSGDKNSISVNEKLSEMGYSNFEAKMNDDFSMKVAGLLRDKEYILSETKPADGFVTATDISFMLKLKIEQAQYSTEVFIKNGKEFIASNTNKVVMYDDTTKIEFSKTDITGEKEVPGCKLEVTDKETGEVVESWTSTKNKHVTEGRYVVGKMYIFTETRPADGFVTADSVEFTVSDTGEIQKVSMKDDTTKVEFSKMASDTKKLLPGAKYKVLDSKGKMVYEFTTTKKAILLEGILKVGETYTFVEEKAPEHYKKAKDVKITVKDTGKVQKLKAVDERIPDVPDTPQTGGSGNIVAIVIAGIFVFITLICWSCLHINRKKKYE